MLDPHQELNGKKGSVTLSCRFDRTLFDLLQNDAKKNGISLNSLMNSIAKKYVSWEKYAAEIGFVTLAKDTVRLIFDHLDENAIKEIANRVGRTIPRELILLMFNKIDFNGIISFLEITLSRYGMIQHNINGGSHDLVLHHSVNRKFSEFLAEIGKVMAEDLSFKFEVLNTDSKILSARIEEISN